MCVHVCTWMLCCVEQSSLRICVLLKCDAVRFNLLRSVSGFVFHEAPIVASAANHRLIVTGDAGGGVCVIAPAEFEDVLSTGYIVNASHLCEFSFLDYNFNECFTPLRGQAFEEEIALHVLNASDEYVSVACLPSKSKVFRCELDRWDT